MLKSVVKVVKAVPKATDMNVCYKSRKEAESWLPCTKDVFTFLKPPKSLLTGDSLRKYIFAFCSHNHFASGLTRCKPDNLTSAPQVGQTLRQQRSMVLDPCRTSQEAGQRINARAKAAVEGTCTGRPEYIHIGLFGTQVPRESRYGHS